MQASSPTIRRLVGSSISCKFVTMDADESPSMVASLHRILTNDHCLSIFYPVLLVKALVHSYLISDLFEYHVGIEGGRQCAVCI